jgi:hypothetical protein
VTTKRVSNREASFEPCSSRRLPDPTILVDAYKGLQEAKSTTQPAFQALGQRADEENLMFEVTKKHVQPREPGVGGVDPFVYAEEDQGAVTRPGREGESR